MAPSSQLRKRTRSALDLDSVLQETPSKRLRRCRLVDTSFNDENQDPDFDVTGNDENDEAQGELKELPTPRHRRNLSQTPTPRHAVMSAGKLFKRMTPQTPLTPTTIQTVYHQARQLFARGAEPGQLVGREAEREQLTAFLDRLSTSSPGGCIYISGPPGTGKSAMITNMTKTYSEKDGVRSAYVNCMSIKSSKDLYHTLLAALDEDSSDLTEAEAISTLQKMFSSKTKSSTTYLVTLDEIDHILTLDLESLYRVFEWSLAKSSRLMLLGIANALDLTDRFLPRLKSKNLKPELLPFLPYTAAQVKNIIITRLKSLMPEGKEAYVPFIHPAAIELCSRKVSSQTGDLRKAFEICRRALDLVEAETRSKHEEAAREKFLQLTPTKKPLGENISNGNSTETAPRASIGHLNKVTAAAFSNGTAQRLKALNLQQKAALCSLVAYENHIRTMVKAPSAPLTPSKTQTLAPTIKVLFDKYCKLCLRDSVLHPLSSSEFREVVGSLETLGLVNAVEGKTGSFVTPQTPSKRGRKVAAASGDERRIASCIGDKEIETIAEGVGADILRSILSGEALD
ncbi:AAA domain-containing protein [Trichoderma breve]|uniref:Cell division control protein n=1 Tax=Trichoderma breve TaxID=2034170 RepID=A0A9W9E1X3_9HYPO|nr:AAA domain-containing protein [Trichoderma breve]KAJ4855213.1 AAA domain-containing protein [Trichoderma breve]